MVVEKPAPIESDPLHAIDAPVPEPGPGEILVRVRTCGVCRTDLHVAEGDLPPRHPRIIPGHEVVGIVDKRGVGAARFKQGDRVGIAWLRETCGSCVYCRRGRENLCPNARFTGYDHDGGYCEYAVVREDFAYALPDSLGDEEAAPLLCAGIIGYPRNQARRHQARRDGRTLRLRRLGPSRDPGAASLGMPRVCDEPRRPASRFGERSRRRMDRQRRRRAARAARRGNPVRAGGKSRAARDASARSRRNPRSRGNLPESDSHARLRETSVLRKRTSQRDRQHSRRRRGVPETRRRDSRFASAQWPSASPKQTSRSRCSSTTKSKALVCYEFREELNLT